MPNYLVKVGTQDGEISQREIRAVNLQTAKEDLRRQGLHVFSAKQDGISFSDLLPTSRSIVSTDRFLLFNQELLALVKAGLPIVQSFDIMLERQKAGRFRDVLSEIREKIKSGIGLSPTLSPRTEARSLRFTPPPYARANDRVIWRGCSGAFFVIRN